MANMMAQSIGVTKGDKRLKQNPIIRNTSPNCRMVSKSCLLLVAVEFFIWFEFMVKLIIVLILTILFFDKAH